MKRIRFSGWIFIRVLLLPEYFHLVAFWWSNYHSGWWKCLFFSLRHPHTFWFFSPGFPLPFLSFSSFSRISTPQKLKKKLFSSRNPFQNGQLLVIFIGLRSILIFHNLHSHCHATITFCKWVYPNMKWWLTYVTQLCECCVTRWMLHDPLLGAQPLFFPYWTYFYAFLVLQVF